MFMVKKNGVQFKHALDNRLEKVCIWKGCASREVFGGHYDAICFQGERAEYVRRIETNFRFWHNALMRKKKIKRNPQAKALSDRLFRQRVVPDKKKEGRRSWGRRHKTDELLNPKDKSS